MFISSSGNNLVLFHSTFKNIKHFSTAMQSKISFFTFVNFRSPYNSQPLNETRFRELNHIIESLNVETNTCQDLHRQFHSFMSRNSNYSYSIVYLYSFKLISVCAFNKMQQSVVKLASVIKNISNEILDVDIHLDALYIDICLYTFINFAIPLSMLTFIS